MADAGLEMPDLADLGRFRFGNNPAMADELLALVFAGKTIATCWAARDFGPAPVGTRSVILDGAGRPRAAIGALGEPSAVHMGTLRPAPYKTLSLMA